MSEFAFVKEERLTTTVQKWGMIALNLRLFKQLPLFLNLLPLSVVTILLSSAGPSFFRWYSGKLFSFSTPLQIPATEISLSFSVEGLILVTLLSVLLRIAAWTCFEISGMWSSQGIHGKMVRSLSLARTTYFDENPSGRLINRLVRDFHDVYSSAIIFMGDFFNAGVEVLSIAVVACFASPWAGCLILPLLILFYRIQFYRSIMIEHARSLSAIATSQVMGRQGDLIEGREIFLLYGQALQLLQRMGSSFRSYVQAVVITQIIEIWASFWIRFSAEIFSFIVLIFMAFALSHDSLDRTLAGVIISSLFGITGSMGWLDFSSGQVSRSAPHVRRVFEIVDLPREEEEEGTTSLKPVQKDDLILSGDLEFENFTMSYRKDTPIILEGLNLKILKGEHVALVGRTGSGKTSLIQSLLRMVYVHGGDIRIGGRSIHSMDIRCVRRLFGVVPQFPYLFSGSLRSNLDRTGILSDPQLKDALQSVGLNYSLEHEVIEGGQNLSLGERQLLCLARVIAADRPVVLMDEPTSGLDPRTDARIHEILQDSLRGKTVLTIAHRRESLGNYDRVIEMQSGKVISSDWII